MGEKQNEPFQFTFNGFLKVAFQGSRVTSDAGLILVREFEKCRTRRPVSPIPLGVAVRHGGTGATRNFLRSTVRRCRLPPSLDVKSETPGDSRPG